MKETSNRYIYHYAATLYGGGGVESKIDGIILLILPLKSYEDYQIVKQLILDDTTGISASAEAKNLRIDSLSFLGMEQD